jgi:hypothetical protein
MRVCHLRKRYTYGAISIAAAMITSVAMAQTTAPDSRTTPTTRPDDTRISQRCTTGVQEASGRCPDDILIDAREPPRGASGTPPQGTPVPPPPTPPAPEGVPFFGRGGAPAVGPGHFGLGGK